MRSVLKSAKPELRECGFKTADEIDEDSDDPDLSDEISSYMDLAVAQLEEQGIVETEPLADKLADDEQDYRITITEKGRRMVAGGVEPKYRDMDL